MTVLRWPCAAGSGHRHVMPERVVLGQATFLDAGQGRIVSSRNLAEDLACQLSLPVRARPLLRFASMSASP